MKTTKIAAFACCAALVACAESTDPETDAFASVDEHPDELAVEGEVTDDDEEIEGAIEVNQEELARIELEHGEVVFLVDVDGPEAGEVTMVEKARPDEEGRLTLLPGDRSPLETFLALTSSDVPVPEALLASERDNDATFERAATRLVVDRLDEPARVSLDRLQAELEPQYWWGPAMCAEGTTSAVFANEICTIDDWTDTTYCHNGTWFEVTDTGDPYWRHMSRSRTLACGSNGRARHYYRFGGVWYKPIDSEIPPDNVYVFSRTTANLLPRKITHSRTFSGFVRGASHFHKF
jgi:hypothetical protein